MQTNKLRLLLLDLGLSNSIQSLSVRLRGCGSLERVDVPARAAFWNMNKMLGTPSSPTSAGHLGPCSLSFTSAPTYPADQHSDDKV